MRGPGRHRLAPARRAGARVGAAGSPTHRAEVQPLPSRQRGRPDQRVSRPARRVDEETAHLLDYAATCYEISEGLFDITSGVLRRAWKFDGSDRVPAEATVADLLPYVGWGRVAWGDRTLTMPAGMEIDLGGIGKEYAVDCAASLIAAEIRDAFVVNFGGDLYASGPRRGGRPWSIGVDDPERTGDATIARIPLSRAASPPAAMRGATSSTGQTARSHPEPEDRLADRRRAAIGDRHCAHLRRGGYALDPRLPSGPRGSRVSRGRRRAVPDRLMVPTLFPVNSQAASLATPVPPQAKCAQDATPIQRGLSAPGTKVIRTLDDNRIRGSVAGLDLRIVPYA